MTEPKQLADRFCGRVGGMVHQWEGQPCVECGDKLGHDDFTKEEKVEAQEIHDDWMCRRAKKQAEEIISMKSVRSFPAFYAMLYPIMAKVARERGYALALHGSLDRDMDLIAVAWTEEAVEADILVDVICERIGSIIGSVANGKRFAKKPHGRLTWALHLLGDSYIDLSVIPPMKTNP